MEKKTYKLIVDYQEEVNKYDEIIVTKCTVRAERCPYPSETFEDPYGLHPADCASDYAHMYGLVGHIKVIHDHTLEYAFDYLGTLHIPDYSFSSPED